MKILPKSLKIVVLLGLCAYMMTEVVNRQTLSTKIPAIFITLFGFFAIYLLIKKEK